MTLERTEVPLHSVIRTALLRSIRSGELKPGDRVPTEPQLIETFQVSRTTVRRALRDLETAGLIDRQPGRGSFVAEPKLEPRLDRLTGFVEDMEALGLEASAEVVTIERAPATPEVAEVLGMAVGESTVHIERIRLANGQPISFDDSYFGEELGSRIAEEDLAVDPFYSILENKYGIPLGRADYVVASAVADARISELLQIEVGSPVLKMDRTSYAAAVKTPLFFEHLHYRGDRMRYRLTLDR
jgi:GntR family transcriptional regulator